MPAIRLIFFDMEGTIFRKCVEAGDTQVAPSSWFTIAQHLGDQACAEEKATQEKWNNGKYTGYLEWMEDTIRIHAKYDLRREVFFRILEAVQFMPGVHEVFKSVHDAGIHTALVTGGFKHQANQAAKALRIKHVFAGCEYFWDDQGILTHWNLLPADYHGKVDFMRSLSKDYGYSLEELAFVGDGQNDIHLAEAVGVSIAFNGHETLREAATHSIAQEPGDEDLRAILPYLELNL
jgi:phosphoserine phosphatase